MKVLVINTMAPFIWGGAEELAEHLVRNLRLRGHDAELLRLPFQWDPYDGIPAEIARFKTIHLSNTDRVISMKFPAYFIPAEHHTTWLIHQYRQAYDLWDSPYNNLPHDWSGKAVRDVIRAYDDAFFARQSRLFTISSEVSRRLKQYNDVDAPPLRAPINDPELFDGGEAQDYILAPGRINSSKRQWMLVEAMRHMPASARLIIAGPPESDADADRLRELVARHNLEEQVTLDLRFVTREELGNYVNHASAVAYLPFQEDSYGYVTMEAFEAGKPVITCTDAGELLDIVIDQDTGALSEPQPEALAAAMAALLYNQDLAQDMGQRGRELWRGKDVNWDSHISRLLGMN